MSNLTLKHLLDYAESMSHDTEKTEHWDSLKTCYEWRINDYSHPKYVSGHGGYGIVEEPCVVHLRMPPLTILPPIDNTMRRYHD
jgi:hypothetical protein